MLALLAFAGFFAYCWIVRRDAICLATSIPNVLAAAWLLRPRRAGSRPFVGDLAAE